MSVYDEITQADREATLLHFADLAAQDTPMLQDPSVVDALLDQFTAATLPPMERRRAWSALVTARRFGVEAPSALLALTLGPEASA